MNHYLKEVATLLACAALGMAIAYELSPGRSICTKPIAAVPATWAGTCASGVNQ